MAAQLIWLQERRIVSLAAGTSVSETQTYGLAVNVLPFQRVTPYVRVLRDAANSLNVGAGTNGVKFDFLTAPLLASPTDVTSNGEVFVDLVYPISLNPAAAISGATVAGNIFTQTAASGKIPYIEAPGGLLIWKCTNLSSTYVNTLAFEIILVCRE